MHENCRSYRLETSPKRPINNTEVIRRAKLESKQVHFATSMDLRHLKNSEVEPKFQKYKGRVVLRGDIVEHDSGNYVVLTEQGCYSVTYDGGNSPGRFFLVFPVVMDNQLMLADPMVGYCCRLGSLALTHTHNDVAVLVQWRTLLSIFLLSRPPPVAPRLLAGFIRELPGLVAAPPGVRAGSSPLGRGPVS